MALPTHTNPLFRTLAWEYIDDHHPELWNQPAPLKVSDRLVDQITAAVAKRVVELEPPRVTANAASQRRGQLRLRLRPQVAMWLADPASYSPYIDEIALERAMAFDWPVVESLTLDERTEFYARLAAMFDPFEDGSESRGPDGELRSATHRRRAFLAGEPPMRDRVKDSVIRRCRRSTAKNRKAVSA